MPAAVILILAVLQDPAPEKLKKFEASFKRSDSSDRKKQEPPEKRGSTSWIEEDDDDDWNPLDDILEAIFSYPFEDNGLRFDDYPYAHGRKYYRTDRIQNEDKEVAFEASMAFGRVEHDLVSFTARGAIRLPSGCDFTFDSTRFVEDVDPGSDRLTLTEYQVNVGGAGGARRRSWQWSAGIGLAVLEGEETSDVGFSVQAALVFYPAAPLSLRFSFAAVAFESATLNDFRAEAAYHFKRFALTAGVRSLVSSRGGDDLTGPTAGLAVFF